MYQNEQNNKLVDIPAIDNNKDVAKIRDIVKTLRNRVDQLTQELDQCNQRTKRLNNKLNSLVNEVKRIESTRR